MTCTSTYWPGSGTTVYRVATSTNPPERRSRPDPSGICLLRRPCDAGCYAWVVEKVKADRNVCMRLITTNASRRTWTSGRPCAACPSRPTRPTSWPWPPSTWSSPTNLEALQLARAHLWPGGHLHRRQGQTRDRRLCQRLDRDPGPGRVHRYCGGHIPRGRGSRPGPGRLSQLLGGSDAELPGRQGHRHGPRRQRHDVRLRPALPGRPTRRPGV